MSFEILLGEVAKRRFMELMLSHLCRIVALRDRSHAASLRAWSIL
jgi:hypothetical protein